MQNKRKKERKLLKAGGLGIFLAICFLAGLLVSTVSLQDVIENPLNPRRWVNYALAEENDPTGDMGGYMYFMTYPHQPSPAVAYASNLTPANAYEEDGVIDSEMNNETPHSTLFDYVIKFRVNDTTSYNTSGAGAWMPDWIYMNITVDHDFATDVAWTEMTLVEIGNNSNFAWYHGYINNADAGYQITNNEKFTATVNCTLWW